MPELPEVETVRRTLIPHLVGRRIVSVDVREPRLREPVDADALRRMLVGREVRAIRRRAKYLLIDVAGGQSLLIHLGMSGRLAIASSATPRAKHEHVVFALDDGRALRFADPRRFGLVLAYACADEAALPQLASLGIEPLEPVFDGAWLHGATRGVKRSAKTWLMDAHVVVGVGNIYASEALHVAGIRPTRQAQRLTHAECDALANAVTHVLRRAIDEGGTTLKDFVSADGAPGAYATRLAVYGREGEPCLRCEAPIRRRVMAGRSTFWCAGCQR